MRLMQKKLTYFLCKYEPRLQMHLKSVGHTDTVLFPTIGNTVNVQWLEIGKPESR
jgi:hypothetical protein